MSDIDQLFLEAAQKLKRTVTEGRVFQAAQIKVIGLDDVRKAAGPKWGSIMERVRTNSMHFLQGALGDGDIVIPCGDGFLVIYEDQPGRNLESETETLQHALNTFYIGDEALKLLKSQVTRHTLSSHEVIGFLGGDTKEEPQSDGADIRFVPICNVAKKAIVSYLAAPAYSAGGLLKFGYNPGYRATGRHETDCDFAALDIALLQKAIAEAARVADGPDRCLVSYSVHVTTLRSRAARERFFDCLRAAPLPARKHLIGKIAEIEVGTPLFNITEWVGVMRSHTQLVSVEFHWTDSAFEGLATTRASVAGFYLPLPAVVAADTRARCRAMITRWRLGLLQQGMGFFLDGVNDAGLLAAALQEGVDFITSEKHWPLVSQATGVRLLNRPDAAAAPRKSA